MIKGAVYNEFDKSAAAWLRELIANGLIAPGDVDERSIKDVKADDYQGYTQVHCFAGIGVWSAALRRARWSDERPIGSASCPCQGFSVAGKGLGFADPRHLWPDYLRLVDEAREQGQPWSATLIGEQSANAGAWLDLVQSDLEDRAYAFGASDIPAAGFGGAHIRQRFYWVADRDNTERWSDLAGRDVSDWPQAGRVEGYGEFGAGSEVRGVDDGAGTRRTGALANTEGPSRNEARLRVSGAGCATGGMGNNNQRRNGSAAVEQDWRPQLTATGDVDWLFCRDRRFRPVETGTFPLAPTHPGRVGLLRGYGNSLDLETAVNFIGAYMETLDGQTA